MNTQEIVAQIKKARDNAQPMDPITNQFPDLDFGQAYQIQRMGRDQLIEGGESLSGYKMGLTSRAKQRDVNVFEPIRGYLLASMALESGDTLETAKRIHTRVEPEVAVIVGQDIDRLIPMAELLSCLSWAGPALEILDSRFHGYSFKLADVIADNTSASGYLTGRENWLDDWEHVRLFGVAIRLNGTVVQTGAPAAVLGDPLRSVAALLKSVVSEGESLKAGQVVLTGGITASVPIKKGDQVEVHWPGETLSFGVN